MGRVFSVTVRVIEIMHVLAMATEYDRVVVLEDGRLIEFDEPQVLLARPSAFAALYQAETTAND